MLSVETSGALSDAIEDILSSAFGGNSDAPALETVNIRKVAHFVEFCVLAIIGCFLLLCFDMSVGLRVALAAFGGLFFPICDETIQIFSQRGSSVRDVWIDIAGYTLGCLVATVAVSIKKKVTNKRKNDRNLYEAR